MAKATSVWGIEIGQSALKALRCRLDGDQVVAEAFDYIEYPKILSQPESDPETLVREALDTFVKRNDLKKTTVAMSVPGQSGLAKFFKPPPVELKKIPDIVKYEARQQIPFDLNDVIWDYQLMAGGEISDGFALESEVGLFAMKRDAVYRLLKPLQAADLEVDLLQLAPLSIYNMVTYDKGLANDQQTTYDSEHPPKSMVVLAMGTDATDLIVTNGYRVWQRSMPLGGNHFTRQLTKELKLTFAKAEHLKRNAMEADDPKLIFQAMRPVFNDLVTEVQRSMGFFRSINKKAEIGSILMLGNSVKLPGLSQYLSKNLAMDVDVIDSFAQLNGSEVTEAAAFKDHIAAFGPVYGLCLQGLGRGPITTNLVPKEVLKERLIRSKKPWAVAAAAALLMGMAGNLLFAGNRWSYVHPDKWQSAMAAAEATQKKSAEEISTDATQKNQVDLLKVIGTEVSGSNDRRLLWMEIVTALSHALQRPEGFDVKSIPSPDELPYIDRTDIHVTKIESKFYDDLSRYLTSRVVKGYEEDKHSRLTALGLITAPAEGEATGDDAMGDEAMGDATDDSSMVDDGELDMGSGDEEGGNSGIVFQIEGFHYHNDIKYAANFEEREGFVLKHLVHELETGSVKLPGRDGELIEFTYKELGLSHPFVFESGMLIEGFRIPNPAWKKMMKEAGVGSAAGGAMLGGYSGGSDMMEGMMSGMMGLGSLGSLGRGASGMLGGRGAGDAPLNPKFDPNVKQYFDAPKFVFKLQLIWKPQPLTARLAAKRAAEEAAAAEAAAAQENPDDLANNAG
ncbi:MAG: pilus assembly protein PilM [Pirellulaceae bacterium]